MAEETSFTAEPDSELPSLEEVRAWVGCRVDDIRGNSVAKVEGVLVDADNGEPVWVLVRMGRFGHYSVLPATHAVGGAGHVWVPYERDLIRRTPRVEQRAELTKDQELVLCAHYGIPETTARGEALADRDGSAVTARPA